MMRSLVLLAVVSLANAEDQAHCALDGARAVDDLLDSATYIWASIQRCGGNAAQKNDILCSLDISSAIESTNAMVNVILKAVEKCGNLEGAHHKCGLAVGVLTRSFAGMAAGASGITAKCPNALNNNNPLVPLVSFATTATGTGALASAQQQANSQTHASFAQCLVDVKDLTKSLFKAIKRIMTLKESCADGSSHCAHNSLKLVAALSAMGEYLAGSVGRCTTSTAATKKTIIEAECSEEAMHLLRHVDNVGRASIDMKENCNVGAERLYQIDHDGEITEAQTGSPVTMVLAAMLPLTAVIAFVGGSRFAKSRVQNSGEDGM